MDCLDSKDLRENVVMLEVSDNQVSLDLRVLLEQQDRRASRDRKEMLELLVQVDNKDHRVQQD